MRFHQRKDYCGSIVIRIYSGCKINLFLKIGKKRPNGLHELQSLFLPLSRPADLLEITPETGGKLRISCNMPELAGPENLLCRAWRLFGQQSGFSPGLHINLLKNIPSGAGLGGGSSNAAALLAWLNGQAPQSLDKTALYELALRIGSDVPFFLEHGAALVEGTGEIVRPARIQPGHFTVLLLWPGLHISTAWAFQALDISRQGARSAPEKNLTKPFGGNTNFSFTVSGESHKSAFRLENDLEGPVFEKYPTLGLLRNRLLGLGASDAGMSGSGSCLFGIFDDLCHARAAASQLADTAQAYIAQWPSAGV